MSAVVLGVFAVNEECVTSPLLWFTAAYTEMCISVFERQNGLNWRLVCSLSFKTLDRCSCSRSNLSHKSHPFPPQPTSQSLPSCLFILTARPCDCSQPTGWLQWGMTSLTSWFPPAAGELHFLLRVFVLKWRLAPLLSLGCPCLPWLLPRLTDVGMC